MRHTSRGWNVLQSEILNLLSNWCLLTVYLELWKTHVVWILSIKLQLVEEISLITFCHESWIIPAVTLFPSLFLIPSFHMLLLLFAVQFVQV